MPGPVDLLTSRERRLNFYRDKLPRGRDQQHVLPDAAARRSCSRWAAEVPAHFSFALKASQRITHRKRLKDAGEDVSYFLRIADVLGAKLGPMLFQLPPNLKKDLPRLEDFLALPAARGVRRSSSATRRGSTTRCSRA